MKHIAFAVFDRMIKIDEQVIANEAFAGAGEWPVFDGNYFPSVFSKIEQCPLLRLFLRNGVYETAGKRAAHFAITRVVRRWYNFVTNVDHVLAVSQAIVGSPEYDDWREKEQSANATSARAAHDAMPWRTLMPRTTIGARLVALKEQCLTRLIISRVITRRHRKIHEPCRLAKPRAVPRAQDQRWSSNILSEMSKVARTTTAWAIVVWISQPQRHQTCLAT
jgi:hypothetical protein